MRIKLLSNNDAEYALTLIEAQLRPQLRAVGAAWDRDVVWAAWRQCENFDIWQTGTRVGILRLRQEDTTAIIEDIHIEASQQRRGLGRAAVEQACHWGQERGAQRLALDVVKGSPAESFYERIGFTCVGIDLPFARMERPL